MIEKEELNKAIEDNWDSIEKQKKQNKHWWMINREWIENVPYHNKEYLTELLDHLFTFISTRPIPVLVKWDTNLNNRIYFNIGQHSKHYEIDPYIAPFDFTYRVEREFLKTFYPMYKVSVTHYRSPSFDEVRDRIQQGMSFSEADNLKIKENYNEIGYIDTVYMSEQTFRITVDGQTSIRMPGKFSGGNILRLSAKDFLTKLRKLQEQKIGLSEEECNAIDEEIKHIIETESEWIKDLGEERPVIIDPEHGFTGRIMVNFIKIHLPDLYKIKIGSPEIDDYYAWGRYRIKFLTKSLRDECFNIISKYRSDIKFI